MSTALLQDPAQVCTQSQSQSQDLNQIQTPPKEQPPALYGTEILRLPIDRIAPNPYQPRRAFDRAPLEDLSQSIREYGVMQPISVRVINGRKYELVAGERRLRASRLAGLTEIPAIVVNISDRDSAVLALIENLQRQNLNFVEEAEGFVNLMTDYGFTQEQLAKRLGKNQSTVANKLRILRLPPAVQKSLLENNLTERHARALLKLDSEDLQAEAVARIVQSGLTVQRTEALVEAMLRQFEPEEKDKPARSPIKSYIKDLRLFTNSIKQAVDMMNDAGVVTAYDVEENKDGCYISILVTY